MYVYLDKKKAVAKRDELVVKYGEDVIIANFEADR